MSDAQRTHRARRRRGVLTIVGSLAVVGLAVGWVIGASDKTIKVPVAAPGSTSAPGSSGPAASSAPGSSAAPSLASGVPGSSSGPSSSLPPAPSSSATTSASKTPSKAPAPKPTLKPTPTPKPTVKPTPTPSVPEPANKPGPSNTGVPAGTKLTVITGDVTVSTNGTVIDGKDIKGALIIDASNVTVRRSLIEGHALEDSVFVRSGTNIVFQDDEVSVVSPHTGVDSMGLRNSTVQRLNIHGGVDGIKLFGNATVTASWIHDLTWFAHDPGQGGGPSHNDTIQILGGSNMNVTGNFLQAVSKDNSAIQVTQNSGKISALTISGNWADGGGCTFNISSHNNAGTLIPMGGIALTNNRFGGHTSKLNCAIVVDLKTTFTHKGNVRDDTGTPVTIIRAN